MGFAAQPMSLGGGVTQGNRTYKYAWGDAYEESSDLGFYVTVSGSAQIRSVPLAFTGSYSAFSADTRTVHYEAVPGEWHSEVYSTPTSTGLLKLFAGYTLPMASISLGGGLVSHLGFWKYGSGGTDCIRLTGAALAAFGSIPVWEKAQIGVQLFYTPIARVAHSDDGAAIVYYPGSGIGYEVRSSYQAFSMLAVEVGYQSFTSKIKWFNHSEVTENLTTSNLFAGVKLTF
jgi:hypothetical protein